jgi:hypothetical protein
MLDHSTMFLFSMIVLRSLEEVFGGIRFPLELHSLLG